MLTDEEMSDQFYEHMETVLKLSAMKILSVALDKEERKIIIKIRDKGGSDFKIKLAESDAESFAKVILRKLAELEHADN